ncbi:hypothetical protein EGW08_008822, partial [Elysia chlorotica]
ADYHDLHLGRLLSEVGPHVHGEDGGAAVEDGRQAGHEGRQHHREHHAPGTGGQQAGDVGAPRCAATDFHTDVRVCTAHGLWGRKQRPGQTTQNPGDHAWEDKHEQGKQLEGPTQQRARLSVTERLGGQGPYVRVYLVGAPVPHRVDGQSQNARPGDVSAPRVPEQVHVVLPGPPARVVAVAGEVGHGARVLVHHGVKAAHLAETWGTGDCGAYQHDDGLDEVRPDNGRETTWN